MINEAMIEEYTENIEYTPLLGYIVLIHHF